MINNTCKIFTLFAIILLPLCNKSIKEEVSEQPNIIYKSMSIETNLEEHKSLVVDPCEYYKHKLGLQHSVNRNSKLKSCSFDYHEISIKIKKDYHNSHYSTIEIGMKIKSVPT